MSSTDGNNQGFQKLVEVAANHLGMGTEFQAIRICHEARNAMERHLPGLQGSYQVISFKNGQLNIAADNSSVMQKIQIKAHLLQEDINAFFGAATVHRVRLKNR